MSGGPNSPKNEGFSSFKTLNCNIFPSWAIIQQFVNNFTHIRELGRISINDFSINKHMAHRGHRGTTRFFVNPFQLSLKFTVESIVKFNPRSSGVYIFCIINSFPILIIIRYRFNIFNSYSH